jgi:hypothetical protein
MDRIDRIDRIFQDFFQVFLMKTRKIQSPAAMEYGNINVGRATVLAEVGRHGGRPYFSFRRSRIGFPHFPLENEEPKRKSS